MGEQLEQWIVKLQRSSLPALKSSVDELLSLSADERAPMDQIAEVVQRDPGLSLQVLRRIGARQSGRLSNEITIVQHALMMLGLNQVRGLPNGLPLDTQLKPVVQMELRQMFARVYHGACQARHWAQLHSDFEPEEVFVATLLHPLAEMLVRTYAPGKMHQVAEMIHHQGMEPGDAEYVALGFTLEDLSRTLAERWRLPSLLSASLHPENAARGRVYTVMLASQLARHAERDWYSHETTRAIAQVAEFLPMSFGSAAAHIHRVAAEAARDLEHLYVEPAAARILFPSRPEADPDWKPPTAEIASKSDEADDADFCLAPQTQVLRAALTSLSAEGGALTLHETLDVAMRGMHEGVGLNRVVFALLSPDKAQLRARAVIGSENDAHFSRFAVDLLRDNLFARLMQKPQALWLDAKNQEKFWPMVPDGVRGLLQTDRFFVMSIFVKEKPVGLFYADRHNKACHLDARAYHRFKQVATALAEALGRFSRD